MKRLIGLKWECVCTFQPAQMANHSCYANASVSLRNALLIHPPAASLILATSARWNSVTHRERWSTVLKVNILILCHMILKFLLERNHPTATVSCLLTKVCFPREWFLRGIFFFSELSNSNIVHFCLRVYLKNHNKRLYYR